MEPEQQADEQLQEQTQPQEETVVEPEAVEAAEEPTVDLTEQVNQLEQQLGERTNDLQRLGAEYANYKRRVDRDRDLARSGGVEAVVLDLLPVLDDLDRAKEHEEMTTGLRMLVDALEKVTTKYGVERFAEKGDPFDPQIHDALMQAEMPGVSVPTCIDVMSVGYKLNGRVLRPARVAVALPNDDEPAESDSAN